MSEAQAMGQHGHKGVMSFLGSHWVGSIAALLGAILTAAGAYLADQALRREKQLFTMERILLEWNEDVSSRKDVIEHHFPGLYNDENTQSFGTDAARSLYRLKGNGGRYRVRQAMVELLNYLEIFSIAYDSRLVDQDMFKFFAEGPMLRWRRVLAPFMKVYNEDRRNCVWEAYERLVDAWAHERSPRPEYVPKPCDGAPPKQ